MTTFHSSEPESAVVICHSFEKMSWHSADLYLFRTLFDQYSMEGTYEHRHKN